MQTSDDQERERKAVSLTQKLIRSEARARALERVFEQVLSASDIDPELAHEGLRIQEALELNGAFRDAEQMDQGMAAILDNRTEEEMQFLLEALETLKNRDEGR